MPDKTGGFALRNLSGGQYSFDVQFFARYWYLRSITVRSPTAASKEATTTTDFARTWFTLKSGDRVTGLKVTLAEGAASLSGQVEPMKDQNLPPQLFVYLAPAEKEKGDDVLRFFAAPVSADGAFALDHLPPGRYQSVVKVASENDLIATAKLRLPDAADLRSKLRREAESVKNEIELKPCQNVTGHQLALKLN